MKKSREKFCTYCGSNQQKMYSVKSLAAMIDCSEQTVRGWIQGRNIGYIRIRGLSKNPSGRIRKTDGPAA